MPHCTITQHNNKGKKKKERKIWFGGVGKGKMRLLSKL
jgi:hypothetical protein